MFLPQLHHLNHLFENNDEDDSTYGICDTSHTRDIPVSSDELASDMAPILDFCIEKFTPQRYPNK